MDCGSQDQFEFTPKRHPKFKYALKEEVIPEVNGHLEYIKSLESERDELVAKNKVLEERLKKAEETIESFQNATEMTDLLLQSERSKLETFEIADEDKVEEHVHKRKRSPSPSPNPIPSSDAIEDLRAYLPKKIKPIYHKYHLCSYEKEFCYNDHCNKAHSLDELEICKYGTKCFNRTSSCVAILHSEEERSDLKYYARKNNLDIRLCQEYLKSGFCYNYEINGSRCKRIHFNKFKGILCYD